MGKWTGVDLDSTLAIYDGWRGAEHIGDPVPRMLERVKRMLAEGREVRIFTARVGDGGRAGMSVDEVRRAIEDWCLKHVGVVLPVTNVKDFHMEELWDDRAVQVVPNTGERADGTEERVAVWLSACPMCGSADFKIEPTASVVMPRRCQQCAHLWLPLGYEPTSPSVSPMDHNEDHLTTPPDLPPDAGVPDDNDFFEDQEQEFFSRGEFHGRMFEALIAGAAESIEAVALTLDISKEAALQAFVQHVSAAETGVIADAVMQGPPMAPPPPDDGEEWRRSL